MKMSNINTSQVQATNDASTVSKCSAVSKNYFIDEFIEEFVNKKKVRTSLIHMGYYTRAVIMHNLITRFIEFINSQKVSQFQIISCGSGFDTTYWRLLQANLLLQSLFIEIDFSCVIQRKISLIKQSQKLQSCMKGSIDWETSSAIHKINSNYYLVEADLSDFYSIEKSFKDINVNFDIPTLFLSECVITYMKESDSQKLIRWMGESFKNCGFVNYEQIHPDDGFGQIMMRHFDKLQSSLHSVDKYPDCESHYIRYKSLGLESSISLSEWNALILLTTESERQRALSLELFDEFEEFHLKCVHYVIAIAGNGMSSDWINSFPKINISTNGATARPVLKANTLPSHVELFRHSSCSLNDRSLVFGGCKRQIRSSKIYSISYRDGLEVKEVKIHGHPKFKLDMVYGAVVYFELNGISYVCLYGGRTSPDKVWNNGCPVVFELINDEFFLRLVINERNPIPRYRTTMVCLKPSHNEVHCWVFGGRTSDLGFPLSDLWQLTFKQDSEKNLTYSWKQVEKENNWPCPRISHSFCAHPENSELFIVGGLSVSSSAVLNDMWKWCCRSESWEKVHVSGTLLPRYGHTSHIKDDVMFLVGGVNALAGMQPGLTRIDLRNLTLVEYSISVSVPEPVLFFNHSSDLVVNDEGACIYVFGGGGNCFSFGTYLNPRVVGIRLDFFR